MRKIRDRILLGVIAGFSANVLKNMIGRLARHLKWAELDGPARASGLLLPAHKLATTEGLIVGHIADYAVSGILGAVGVYALSISGTNKAVLKGALAGSVAWTTLYGAIATMGATQVRNLAPRTVLSEFVAHTVFGAAAAKIAVSLGDPALFSGDIPLSASTPKHEDSYEPVTDEMDRSELHLDGRTQ